MSDSRNDFNDHIIKGRSRPYKFVMLIILLLYAGFVLFINVPLETEESSKKFYAAIEDMRTLVLSLVPILFTYGTESLYNFFSFSDEDEKNKNFEVIMIKVVSVFLSVIIIVFSMFGDFSVLLKVDKDSTITYVSLLVGATIVSVLLIICIGFFVNKLEKISEKHRLVIPSIAIILVIVGFIYYDNLSR